MSSVDTRFFEPKPVTELLASAFRKCFANSGAAFVTVAAMLVPVTVISLIGQYLMGKSGLVDFLETMQSGRFDPTQMDFAALPWVDFAMAGACLAVGALGSLMVAFAGAAAVAQMLAERALGREFGPGAAWDFVLGRLLKLVGGAIVLMVLLMAGYTIAAIPGSILSLLIGAATGQLKPGGQPPMVMQLVPMVIIIPAISVLATYLVSMPAAAGVEDLGGIGAALRSFRLVPGKFRHVFPTIVLAGLLLFAVPGALQVVMQKVAMSGLRESFGDATGVLLANLPGTVLGFILAPILYTLQAVIYFDLRARQLEEDFTPYQLALDVGGELPEGVEDPMLAGLSSESATSPVEPDAGAAS